MVPLQILGSGNWLARPPYHLKSWCQKKAPLPVWEVLEMRYTLPEVMQWILGHTRSEASGTCSKITVTSVGRGVERGIFSWMSHRSSSLFCATLAVGLLDQRVQDSGPAPVSRHKWQRDRTAMHCCELCAFSCKLPHQRMHACIHTPSRRLAEKPQNSASIYSRKIGLYVCTSGACPFFQDCNQPAIPCRDH